MLKKQTKQKITKQKIGYLFLMAVFVFLMFFTFTFEATAQGVKPLGPELGVIDKAIKLTRSVLDKLAFVKSIWSRVVAVYEEVKSVLVNLWDKYLDKYLGKYVAIIKENIKQGIEEEKEELKEAFFNLDEEPASN